MTKRLGLIVLSTDEVLENEARRFFEGSDISLLHSRIPANAEVTPDDLGEMAARLPAAAALLPAGVDVIGYGCTSASTVIGSNKVASLVNEAHPKALVTNPLQAALAAFQTLKIKRIGFVSPYIETVAAPMKAAFEAAEFEIVGENHFGESKDAVVAQIPARFTADAVRKLAGECQPDAIFISCTNVKIFSELPKLETQLGIPILSSNLALLWHMSALAGIKNERPFAKLQSENSFHKDTQ